MKVYRTFEEIEHDLKVLKLQSEIDKEQLKLGVARIKEDFSPLQMVASFVGSIAKKAVLLRSLADFVGLGRKRH